MDRVVTVWSGTKKELINSHRGLLIPESLPIDISYDERGFVHFIDDT